MDRDELRQQLARFDGKHTAPLEAAAAAQLDDDAITALVEDCVSTDGHRATAATWVVKARVEKAKGKARRKRAAPARSEEGERTDTLPMEEILTLLPRVSGWEPTLHLLQCVQWVRLPAKVAQRVRKAVRPLLVHDKTLVRVWALDAYVRLSMAQQGVRKDNGGQRGAAQTRAQKDARAWVEAALEADEASMRARARALLKLLDSVA